MKISYQPKWKEELVGTYGEHEFTVEMTMGKAHVFFPEESIWEENPPPWAIGVWSEAKNAAMEWAESQGIPFTIDKAAWVYFNNKVSK